MKKFTITIASILVLFFGFVSCSDDEAKTETQNQVASRLRAPILAVTVQIGSQVWMTRNLNVSRYSDGTIIPQVTNNSQWGSLTIGAWCYFQNNALCGPIYGKLYNWYAVAGIYDNASLANPGLRKKLTPAGWHVPSDAEWTTLTNFLGGEDFASNKLRSTGTTIDGTGLWQYPNTGATNSSGFTGHPGGKRDYTGSFYTIGTFGASGDWWSSTEMLGGYSVFGRRLMGVTPVVMLDNYDKNHGCSVRCLRD